MTKSKSLTLRALAALLRYPDGELRAALPELGDALDRDCGLSRSRLAELDGLMRWLFNADPYEVEARYVETFDRGRATSLHLFEHVHGDSRERGPALIDLLQTYERAGLLLRDSELPDHLPVVLEFASTQSDKLAREFLGETAHILNAIFSALLKRESPYASVIAAVQELAGHKAQAVPVAAEAALDEAWAEPPAFDGCSTRGQARPDTPQPIQIVRKTPHPNPLPGGEREPEWPGGSPIRPDPRPGGEREPDWPGGNRIRPSPLLGAEREPRAATFNPTATLLPLPLSGRGLG